MQNLRYQVVVLGSEIGSAMTIDAISFVAAPETGDFSSFDEYRVYMGPTTLNSLGTVFDDNYSGPRLNVFDHSNVTHMNQGGMVTIPLDTPYFHAGTGNLLIEIDYQIGTPIPGNQSVYVMYCSVPDDRMLRANASGAQSGQAFPFLAHMYLNGTLSFQARTFGAIKASFD